MSIGDSLPTKHLKLDAVPCDAIRLHSGDPGAAGTDFALGAGLSAATFSAAASGERALAAAVEVTGLAPGQSVLFVSVWGSGIFRTSMAITSGDVVANAIGSYNLALGTKMIQKNADEI